MEAVVMPANLAVPAERSVIPGVNSYSLGDLASLEAALAGDL
jgi:hypothetical protein